MNACTAHGSATCYVLFQVGNPNAKKKKEVVENFSFFHFPSILGRKGREGGSTRKFPFRLEGEGVWGGGGLIWGNWIA